MEVIIDTRETRSKLPKILEQFAKVTYAPLAYGDYQVSNDLVFERKTFSDWEGSVIDGRIFKQAEGLRGSFKTPIFILEGGPDYSKKGRGKPVLTKKALHSSMLSITTGYGIPIIPTNNPTESANLILQAARREQEGKKDKSIRINTHKKGKTLKEQRMQVFACFPGIGPKLANELASLKFPLMEILKNIETVEIDKFGPKKKKAILDVLYDVKI